MLRWTLAILAIFTAVNLANADVQNPTLFGVKKNGATNPTSNKYIPPTPPPTQVMPSSNFGSAAAEEHTQIKSTLKQQMQNELNANKPNYKTTNTPATDNNMTMDNVGNQGNAAPAGTTPEATTAPSKPITSTKLPTSRSQTPPTSTQPSPSPYTGFGTGTPKSTGGSSGSQGSSSGWGIKY